MFKVFQFYLDQLKKVFAVMNSWEMFPGVTYLEFVITCILLIFIIKLLKFGYDNSIVRPTANEISYRSRQALFGSKNKKGGK